MMSEPSPFASRLARWSGSLDRNGLTGRLAPAGVLVLTADGAGAGAAAGEKGLGDGGAAGDGGADRDGGTYGGGTGGVKAGGAAGAGRCGALGVEKGEESHAPCVGGVARGRAWAGLSVPGEIREVLPEGVLVPVGAGMVMIPLHTEQRARTPVAGTLAGSTRKTERHSGQLTFIHFLPQCAHPGLRATAPA